METGELLVMTILHICFFFT